MLKNYLFCFLTIFTVVLTASGCHQAPVKLTEVQVLAGIGVPGALDEIGTKAVLNRPHGMAQSADGIIYFADRGNNQIRSYNPSSRQVLTIAGTIEPGNEDGIAREAKFDQPVAVAVNSKGMIYVADRNNHKIRSISPEGRVTTVTGDGVPGYTDGHVSEAQFNEPYGLAFDMNEENLFIADYLNHAIRKIHLRSGIVTTVAGNGEKGNVDGVGRQARLNQPYNIVHDGFGNFYIPDQKNHSIRILGKNAKVMTLAGNGQQGYANGKGKKAQFNNPTGLAVVAGGIVYVADRNNSRIRKITAGGLVTNLSGTGNAGELDGPLSEAEFNEPLDILFDRITGTLVISEDIGHRLRNVK